MSQIDIDDDILRLLEQMKQDEESLNDVLRKILVNFDTKKLNSIEIPTLDEFKESSDKIMEKYHDLLVELAK